MILSAAPDAAMVSSRTYAIASLTAAGTGQVNRMLQDRRMDTHRYRQPFKTIQFEESDVRVIDRGIAVDVKEEVVGVRKRC